MRSEFLGGCEAVQGQRESLVVVAVLPGCDRGVGVMKCELALAVPEFFGVDSMTAFDLPVLLRAPGPDSPEDHPTAFHLECEFERELVLIVALKGADRERHVPLDLPEESDTGRHVMPAVEPQDAVPRAVVQGGVLKHSPSGPPERN